MQQSSEVYKALLADPLHVKEVRVLVNGAAMGEDKIVSMSTSGGLFQEDGPGIGGAVAREIDLILFLKDPGIIPRMAELRPGVRLIRDGQSSEWLQKGVFYIDTRSKERVAGGTLLTIHGFDAMLKGEEVWVPDQSLEFPMPMPDAAAEIARLMGVELDARTVLDPTWTVDYPANDYTRRDVLRFIAAAHGGNWVITDEGRLLLVPLAGGLGGRTSPGTSSLETGDPFDPVSMVTVLVDDNNCYEAGGDSGYRLEATCPYGSQAMADALLARLGGYIYQPIRAEGALLDPAAELGDMVTADGVDALLARADITFDMLCACDIAAPGQRELESEYPYQSGPIRALERKIAATRSIIEKNSEEIRLAVETVNQEAAKLAEFNITVDRISSRVEAAEIGVSKLTQTVSGFEAAVKNLQTGMSQTLRIAADGVTITNASGSKLTIDGGQLKANSITASKIDVDSLYIKKVYGSNNKMCIGESTSNTLFIGGDGTWNYTTTRIFAGSQISLSDYDNPAFGVLFDMNGKSVTSSTLWTLGTSSKPWGATHTGTLNVYAGTTAGTVITANQMYCKQKANDLGTANYPWEAAHITKLVLNGVLLYPDRVSYSSSIYAYMNSSKQFVPYASTGYDLGSSSYPWQDAYVTNLHINGTKFDPSAITVSALKNSTYSVALSTAPALYPGTSNSYSLGTSSYYWKTAYITTLYLSSTCYISAGSASTIKVGTTTIGGGSASVSKLVSGSYEISLSTSGVITPKSSGAYTLGSTSYYWKAIYASTIYLMYSSYSYLSLTCNSSKKLCVNGTAIH